eukprot:COSAG05_NODE_5802_length_1084_cov_299.328825_1_plen_361_part_11
MQFNFFRCPYNGCLGGPDAACQTSNETGLGHNGALCAACHEDYMLRDGNCVACDTVSATTPLLITAVIVLVCIFAHVLWVSGVRLWRAPSACAEDVHEEAAQSATGRSTGAGTILIRGSAKALSGARSSLKISIGLGQILSELPTVLDLQYPPLFTNTLELLRVLMLDAFKVFRLDCITRTSIHSKFVITMLTPVVAIVVFNLMRLLSVAKLHTNKTLDSAQVAARKRELSASCSSRSFGSLFLLYPMLSRTAFRMFICRELDHQERWHVDEYTVDCTDRTHEIYQGMAVIAILIYPVGVPLVFSYLLHKHRAVLSCGPHDLVGQKIYSPKHTTGHEQEQACASSADKAASEQALSHAESP